MFMAAMAKILDVKIMFVAVVFIGSFFDGAVGARTNILEDIDIDLHLKRLNKPAVKTIEVVLLFFQMTKIVSF